MPNLRSRLDVLLGAAAHVLRLGERAQELVLQLGLLGLQLLHFAATPSGLERNIDGWVRACSTGISAGAPPAVGSLAIRYP